MRLVAFVAFALLLVYSAAAVNICIPSCTRQMSAEIAALVAVAPTSAAAQVSSEQAAFGKATVASALRNLNKPYVFGSVGPDSFDCSGLVQYAFGLNGVALPRTSTEQASFQGGLLVSSREGLIPGDIVYFTNPGHTGIFVGYDADTGSKYTFVSASGNEGEPNGKVKKSRLDTDYWSNVQPFRWGVRIPYSLAQKAG